jgi:hypothetical protein
MATEQADVEVTQLQPPADMPQPTPEGGGEQQQPAENGDAAPKLPGYVREEALREAREEAKRVREEARQSQARLAGRLDELYRLQEQAARPQPDQAPAKPDPEPDKQNNLADWLEWKARDTERQVQSLAQREQQSAQQRQWQEQSQAEMQALGAQIAPHVMSFRQQVPDYDQAAQHAQMTVYNTVLSNGAPPAQAAKMTQDLIAHTAKVALAWGVNPAAMMYQLAGATGYRSPQQPMLQPQAQAQAPEPNGQEQPQRDEQGRFIGGQAPREPPKSLGNMSGGPGGRVSLNDLDRMSDNEFHEYMMGKSKGLRRIHGI